MASAVVGSLQRHRTQSFELRLVGTTAGRGAGNVGSVPPIWRSMSEPATSNKQPPVGGGTAQVIRPALPKPQSLRELGRSRSQDFGSKTIGFWSSCCLNLNNVMGAAIVALPLVTQQAGWLTPTLCIFFIFLVSSFASTMLVEAMQRIPGNADLTQRWEFCAVVGHYHGPRAQRAVSWVYILSLQATNVASMIVSAQVLDQFIIYAAGRSYALDYHRWPPQLIHSEPSLHDPWLTQWVISVGFLVSMVIAIPLGYINLEDNMKFQWVSLAGLLVFTAEFFVQFTLNVIPGTRWYEEEHQPRQSSAAAGQPQHTQPGGGAGLLPVYRGSGQYQVLGMAIFAYAYVTTIPSWANEKRPS
jgi:amino acid transporter